MNLSRIILGTNPFEGISYLSRDKAASYLEKFSKKENVLQVMQTVASLGIDTIMCANNEVILDALNLLSVERKISVIPIVPNAYEYVRDATNKGVLGAVRERLKRVDTFAKFRFALSTVLQAKGIISKDTIVLLSNMLELELAAFCKFNVPVVALHGHIADLAISLMNREILSVYAELIRETYEAQPAIATHNFGRILPIIEEWDLDIPIIIAPFNKKGFMMKPNKDVCEKILEETDKYIIAKKVLAGGSIQPEEAFAYLQNKPVGSIVVGIASVAEAHQTLAALEAASGVIQ